LEYSEGVYTDLELVDGQDKPSNDIPPADSSTSLPPPSAPLISNINNTANTPNFTLATTISTGTSPVAFVEWFYSDNTATNFQWLDNSVGTPYYSGGQIVTDVITNLVEAGTWYFKARTGVGGLYSNLSEASAALVWDPQPAGASDGSINSSTQAVNLFVNSVSSGQYALALTTGTNTFVPFSSDPEFNVNVATNKMYIGPWEVSTNTNAVWCQFIATNTQSIATSTEVVAITFTQQQFNGSIIHQNTTTLFPPVLGQYLVSISAMFENTGAQSARAVLWLRKNGTDVPDTATAITVPGKHGNTNGTAVLAVSVIENCQANDEIQWYWNAETANISLRTIGASGSPPIYPRAPAVLLTSYKMAGGFG
jgi:hypothetical protein